MKVLFLILTVFAINDPPQYTVEERVDLIEVNHYHDKSGEFILNQVIFYEWSPTDLRFQIQDYKLMKQKTQFPARQIGDEYFSVWHDGNILRCVSSGCFSETWTQHDPNHKELSILKNENRCGLAEGPSLKRR